jgi:hypothetical protein
MRPGAQLRVFCPTLTRLHFAVYITLFESRIRGKEKGSVNDIVMFLSAIRSFIVPEPVNETGRVLRQV